MGSKGRAGGHEKNDLEKIELAKLALLPGRSARSIPRPPPFPLQVGEYTGKTVGKLPPFFEPDQ
jgi:hypothetical protein